MVLKNILHLYSNHKWTGPADHALNLAAWQKTASRVNPIFACSRRDGSQNHLRAKAGERQLSCLDDLFLYKHLHWKIAPDVFSLKKIVARQHIDVIHCHQDNDALTTVLAGFGHRMVRTCYDGQPFALNFRQRVIFRHAAKIMTASHQVGNCLSAKYPHKNIEQVDIPVDLVKFRPMPKSLKLQKEFGISSRDPVAGIVARVQKHRNFSLLIEALEQIVKEIPKFKFLIVGRGTLIDTIARQPIQKKGLQNQVIFAGYRKDDYRDVLNLFDFKIFLYPGSDGACRAVREAMACGKPVIATKRGILPELIKDGETGVLVDENPQALAKAMITLVRENQYRLELAHAARTYAQVALNPERYLKKVIAGYEAVAANEESKRIKLRRL